MNAVREKSSCVGPSFFTFYTRNYSKQSMKYRASLLKNANYIT